MEYLLEMEGIHKSFPGVTALDNVDFRVKPGEIHSLMGENGAGKSTLIKILTGVYSMDEGSVLLEGKKVEIHSTIEAQRLGISTVYQELNMIPHLSVAENIFLGRYPRTRAGLIDWKKLYADAQCLLDDMGLTFNVKKPLSSYGTATQQMISIIRAISLHCKIIVLDEPTSSLDTAEVEILFAFIRKLKEQKIAVIFISHRLDEVFAISDRISILKDGCNEGTYDVDAITPHDLVTRMVGREIVQCVRPQRSFNGSGVENVVELEHIFSSPKLRDISLRVRKGEIVGLAGLLGSGRTETAQVIFGYRTVDQGRVLLHNVPCHLRTPKDARNHRLAFCTENRREEGIVPNMSVRDNILLSSYQNLQKGGFIDRRAGAKVVDEYIGKFNIKTPSPMQSLKNLSGGNQQKVILARWLATNPDFIIFDEPTRGIDVGAKKEVESLIAGIAQSGIGVIFISSEMQEMTRNCDRIYVMRDGRIIGEISGDEITQDHITGIIAQGKAQ